MAITYVGSGAAACHASGYGTLSVPLPAGVQEGDLLILWHISTVHQTDTTPSGWTKVGPASKGAGYCYNSKLTAYWKIAGASETDPDLVTAYGNCMFGLDLRLGGWCSAFRGATGVGATQTSTYGSSSSVVASGVTTTTDDAMVVFGSAVDQSNWSFSGGNCAGLVSTTEAVDHSFTAGPFNFDGAMWYGIKTTAGATGNLTGTYGASVNQAHIAFSLGGPGDIDFEVDPALGVEVGLATPSLDVPDDRAVYPSRAGIEVGLRDVLLTALAKRQVMLTGADIETPAMTEGGDEGDVLTQHQGRPPTWEAPEPTGRWVPLMDGHGNVLTDSGSGAAIMAQVAQE